MSHRLFRPRAGTTLAWARVAMLALFGLWLSLDRHQAAWAIPGAAVLFAVYAAAAVLLAAIAPVAWWWEQRLAAAALTVDGIMFVVGLYATEAVSHDLFSVFITFFAFIVLSSATRWRLPTTVIVTTALAAGFLLAGLLLHARGADIDIAHFSRRLAYLVVLAGLLIWFVRGRPWGAIPRLVRDETGMAGDPLGGALAYAMQAYSAGSGIIGWIEDDALGPRVAAAALPVPERWTWRRGGRAMLFRQGGRGGLGVEQGRHLIPVRPEDVPDPVGLEQGLAIPLCGQTGHGLLVLGDIPQLGFDDLFSTDGIAAEVVRAIDDEASRAIARELAMARLRSQLAADLHDGVAQTLSGVRYRLEGLREALADGRATVDEVGQIAAGVAAEQQHVRTMIDRLRRGTVAPGRRDLRHELVPLVAILAMQWNIRIEWDGPDDRVPRETAEVYEIQQLVREAVANAVRHGGATCVVLALAARGEEGFRLTIRDDGTGCAAGQEPRSIARRAATLGGTMQFMSAPGMTRVVIDVPGADA